MMLRVISTAFLVFVSLRVLSNLSAIQVTGNRHGNDTVKLVIQFEKRDYMCRKLPLN